MQQQLGLLTAVMTVCHTIFTTVVLPMFASVHL